ncbi:MAG: glycerophosphodiester phosphodiesterase [Bacteroidota bacterium]|nr:glycerophosphodiester phosphodiesterase [Bacteroidota bacterium]
MKSVLFFVSLMLTMSCNTGKHMQQAGVAIPFDYEGHRGCRGLMPENTIPAFMKALDLHVTTLEMDAVVTKDNEVIISHEPFFNHEITTRPDGKHVSEGEEKQLNIYTMSYAQTQQFDVGLKLHPRFPKQQKISAHKPRLADVIDSVEAYCINHHLNPVQYNIETKSQPATDGVFHPAPAAFVELIMAIVKAKKIEERVIIQSFDIRTLQYLHEHYPSIKTAYLFEPPSLQGLAARLKQLGFIPTIYSPEHTIVTALLVKQCKALGMKLIPWTVDDVDAMLRLKKMGVDGLISDYPDLYNRLR